MIPFNFNFFFNFKKKEKKRAINLHMPLQNKFVLNHWGYYHTQTKVNFLKKPQQKGVLGETFLEQ